MARWQGPTSALLTLNVVVGGGVVADPNGGAGGGGSYSAATPSFAQSGAQSGNGEVSFCFTVAFAGTPGFSNCHGKSVAALAQQYGGLTTAAATLGFPGSAGIAGWHKNVLRELAASGGPAKQIVMNAASNWHDL